MNPQRCECGTRINYRRDSPTVERCYKCRRKPGGYVPCPDCGHDRRRRNIDAGQQCRNCVRLRNAAQAELREDARIDWVAVERVIAGGSANLNRSEWPIVVRALTGRIFVANSKWLAPGKTTTVKLAARMGGGITADGIRRMIARLPEATRRVCPQCRGYMWVVLDCGVVEQHGNGIDRCPMSGKVFRELVNA